ncbi:HHIP-like protein 2 isoform X1 [Hydra vulgaris]|uniref:HHIP-like protein 2 isoform X1 n=1 Tax=Hydra vulgaris TaxID=6087 RepID=UPI001F5F684C|nr:HHIP-like protein 2 [Hydra vulgaris]
MILSLLNLILLSASICRSDGHPQCLDFRPPFKPIEINFCHEYSQFGCCTSLKDKYIEREYNYIIKNFNSNASCFDSIKDMLCLECHPYAAHIFDIEIQSTRAEKNFLFPGLCKNFCYEFFENCRSLLSQIYRNDGLTNFINSSLNLSFCEWAQISNSYCYPSIKFLPNNTETETSNDTVFLCVETSRENYFNPLFGTHSNDGSQRLFIVEQRGTVFIVDHNGKKYEKPFLNITDKVLNSGLAWDERGLLCLVFHPYYKTNGRFFLYYSAEKKSYPISSNKSNDHVVRISEFTVDPLNPNMADHNSELVLLEINQPEDNHNGGMMLFGDDGYLYISVGDGGGRGDQHGEIGNGLNMSSFLGKLLRIDVDSDNFLYSIPEENPFVNNSNTKPEIYAFGIRNSWRCSKDRETSPQKSKSRVFPQKIFCGDVGQKQVEEINLINKGGNYGWRAFEGHICFDEKLCFQKHENLNFPILSYNHSTGQSIVGGYVYRGCENPSLYGKYLYADTMNGRMFLAEEKKGVWESKSILMANKNLCNNGLHQNYYKHILSFAENEAGELFILAVKYPHPLKSFGKIYKLVDPLKRGDPETCINKLQKPIPLNTINRRKIYEKQKQNTQ